MFLDEPMQLRPLALFLALALPALPAVAEQASPAPAATAPAAADVQGLLATLKMDEILAVMREEGLKYGQSLEDDMFPGRGGDRWQAVVGLIYDTERMRATFAKGLEGELGASPEVIAAAQAFFGSATGQEALKLEIEARRALLDNAAEDAAKIAWEDMLAKGDARVARIERFAAANDLIESNVMGALNANLAFYRGLAETGAFPEEMTEDQMLADVWGQEAEVRADTEDWLFPFLSLAYQPMSDAGLDAYIAFSETPAGKALNAALFAAFDKVFTEISQDLGRGVARQLQGEDI
mgnify:CR=1 FL=1